MKYRIAIWATAGFLVAAGWAIYAFATFPETSDRMRDLWALISVTCPVAIAGKHFPLSMYLVMVANAATYAVAGVIVEAARRQLHHAK